MGQFEPEYIGNLAFYLEALDRDVRKVNEGPSIGVPPCASKDDEVVEYALSRTLSPALIAEYQTHLPDKTLLQAKLHEFYLQNTPEYPATFPSRRGFFGARNKSHSSYCKLLPMRMRQLPSAGVCSARLIEKRSPINAESLPGERFGPGVRIFCPGYL